MGPRQPSQLLLKRLLRFGLQASAVAFGAAFPFYILPALFRLPGVVVGLTFGLPIFIALYAQSRLRARDPLARKDQTPAWWQLGSLPLATEGERALRLQIRVCLGALAGTLAILGASLSAFQSPAGVLAGVGIIWVTVMVMLALTARLSAAHFGALQILRRDGYRICPGCTYDLSKAAAGAGVCPECGRPFDEASLKERWEEIYAMLQRKPGP